MKKNVFALVMAGGRGERFWPLSRDSVPKPFAGFIDGPSLIQRTVRRVGRFVPDGNILIATNRRYVPLVVKALPGFPRANIIPEPCVRDTAPCICLAAAIISARAPSPDTAMVVLPADHMIEDEKAFALAMERSAEAAISSRKVVTIGIKPDFPSTAYGYIQCGDVLPGRSGTVFRKGLSFVEKPDLAKARRLLAGKRHLWNSGIFIWSLASFELLLRKHNPGLFSAFEDFRKASQKKAFAAHVKKQFPGMKKISIDYALMEKLDSFVVAEASFDWDDLGSWDSVAKHFPTDGAGNRIKGADIAILGSRDNIVANYGKKHLLALLDLDGIVLVHTPHATLACPKASAQKLKALVQRIGLNPKLSKFL